MQSVFLNAKSVIYLKYPLNILFRYIVQSRANEEKDISLTISLYDTIRNHTELPDEDEKETGKNKEDESKTADVDYLSPFLLGVADPLHLTREEALAVKDAALKAMKERLIEKAQILQARNEEETNAYQKRQAAFKKNQDQMTAEEQEEYTQWCNETLFRIHILEKRLNKHKETAPERYVALDRKLRADPRLARYLN